MKQYTRKQLKEYARLGLARVICSGCFKGVISCEILK